MTHRNKSQVREGQAGPQCLKHSVQYNLPSVYKQHHFHCTFMYTVHSWHEQRLVLPIILFVILFSTVDLSNGTLPSYKRRRWGIREHALPFQTPTHHNEQTRDAPCQFPPVSLSQPRCGDDLASILQFSAAYPEFRHPIVSLPGPFPGALSARVLCDTSTDTSPLNPHGNGACHPVSLIVAVSVLCKTSRPPSCRGSNVV